MKLINPFNDIAFKLRNKYFKLKNGHDQLKIYAVKINSYLMENYY